MRNKNQTLTLTARKLNSLLWIVLELLHIGLDKKWIVVQKTLIKCIPYITNTRRQGYHIYGERDEVILNKDNVV